MAQRPAAIAGMCLDPARVASQVAGYGVHRTLPAATALGSTAYLKPRGLQLIVRATRAGALDCFTHLERIDRIASQQDELQAVLSVVLDSQCDVTR